MKRDSPGGKKVTQMGLVSEGLPALKDEQMSKKLIIFPIKKHHLKIEALKHV